MEKGTNVGEGRLTIRGNLSGIKAGRGNMGKRLVADYS